MNKIGLLYGIVFSTILLYSCDDNTDTIGNSLTNAVDQFEIITDTFPVRTRSIVVDSVLSQSRYCYLGKIKDAETQTYVTSNYMTQFSILESLDETSILPSKNSITSRNQAGEIIAESSRIQIYFYSSIGDSLNSMQLTVYEMDEPMREDTTYYTNFSPENLLRKDNNAIITSKVYSPVDLNLSDSIRDLIVDKTNMEFVTIPLNKPYIDKNNIKYENYGTYIMRMYYDHPEYFKNSYRFIHNVCPGFYIKSTDGLGVMSEVYLTELAINYKYKEDDTEYNGILLLSGTEEVLQATNIVNDRQTISKLATNDTCTYLKTPAGIFTEVTLPIESIFQNHEKDDISSAKIVFNHMNPKDADKALDIPSQVLLLPKDSLYKFFEDKNLPDNKYSYIASYNTTYNTYTFNNISTLINAMYENMLNGNINDNWNKVVLVPVSISYNQSSSSSSITNVTNDMSLKSVRLVGGDNNRHAPITISIIYNKFIKD